MMDREMAKCIMQMCSAVPHGPRLFSEKCGMYILFPPDVCLRSLFELWLVLFCFELKDIIS
jgi:hypothetical protein